MLIRFDLKMRGYVTGPTHPKGVSVSYHQPGHWQVGPASHTPVLAVAACARVDHLLISDMLRLRALRRVQSVLDLKVRTVAVLQLPDVTDVAAVEAEVARLMGDKNTTDALLSTMTLRRKYLDATQLPLVVSTKLCDLASALEHLVAGFRYQCGIMPPEALQQVGRYCSRRLAVRPPSLRLTASRVPAADRVLSEVLEAAPGPRSRARDDGAVAARPEGREPHPLP